MKNVYQIVITDGRINLSGSDEVMYVDANGIVQAFTKAMTEAIRIGAKRKNLHINAVTYLGKLI